MSEHALSVWAPQGRVGTLFYDSDDGSFRFDYDSVWIARLDAYPITPHLPLHPKAEQTPQAHSNTVRRFISNLLPEGKTLDDVASAYQISKNNSFALIAAIGQETTGALRFLPADAISPDETDERRLLSLGELSERIRERPGLPFSVWDGRVRLSAAGVQDKIAAYRDDASGAFYLVQGRYSSTHILKPEPVVANGVSLHMVANEHYCMRLAQALGLPVANVELLRVPEPVLVVQRFDRAPTDSGVVRKHVIDGCQLLDFPVDKKYERNLGESNADVRLIREGVSFPRLFAVADTLIEPALYRRQLIQWLAFQVLIQNGDAHGKNLSYFVEPAGMRLTPAYDLVCITPYPQWSNTMSMAIGDEFQFEALKPYDWASLAATCGLDRPYLSRTLTSLAKAALTHARPVANAGPYTGDERELVANVVETVLTSATRLLEAAKEIPKISADLL